MRQFIPLIAGCILIIVFAVCFTMAHHAIVPAVLVPDVKPVLPDIAPDQPCPGPGPCPKPKPRPRPREDASLNFGITGELR